MSAAPLDPRRDEDTVTIFERSREGRRAFSAPELDVPEVPVDGAAARSTRRRERPAELPEVLRARDRAPLHHALVEELPPRRGLLPARLVHDEAQPEAARAAGGAARATPGCTRSRTPSTPRARSS